ncbi:MAG: hypothetical protein ACU833_15220 [Gammaproteobacteria bacterium]
MIERRVTLEKPGELMPMLAGKVFHVTPTSNMPAIEADGAIKPNLNSEWCSLFGNSKNSFFRFRGCVSFFDYRSYGSEKWNDHAYKCTPDQILRSAVSISILVLAESKHGQLESWEAWKKEEKWSQRVVPVVEAGFPGAVSLEFITEHWSVAYARS